MSDSTPLVPHTISWGNIITVAVLAAGILAGFVTTQNTTQANALAIDKMRIEFQNDVNLLRIEIQGVTSRASEDREQALKNQIELTRLLTELQADVRHLRERAEQRGPYAPNPRP